MAKQLSKVLILATCAFLSACGEPLAHGDANALIVAADPALWTEVENVFTAALEPTFQAVRNERPFRITYQNPTEAENWVNLRRFRQVLVLGDPSEPWVDEALGKVRSGERSTTVPRIVQVNDVWARNQLVSVLVLPASGRAAAVENLADGLQELLNEQYQEYARQRMFVTGANTGLADSLLANAGFSLTLPLLYQYSVLEDVFRFRNDNPSPAQLIREISVSWESPMPEDLPSRPELEEWRQTFSDASYNDAQELDLAVVSYGPITVGGLEAVEFQSAWKSPDDAWPAGGPFITRAIRCPSRDRLYMVDAWLYAPNKDKYEYMIQLETILDSFRCQ